MEGAQTISCYSYLIIENIVMPLLPPYNREGCCGVRLCGISERAKCEEKQCCTKVHENARNIPDAKERLKQAKERFSACREVDIEITVRSR